jgi:hypothetical protein
MKTENILKELYKTIKERKEIRKKDHIQTTYLIKE